MIEVVLKFIAGPLQGVEFPLDSSTPIVIGRADDADLRIVEETISRKHAKISFRNGEIVIEDLSKNGTYVNSRPIQKAILLPDDLVYIGQSVIKVILPCAELVQEMPGPGPVVSSTEPSLTTFGSSVRLEQAVITGIHPSPARCAPAAFGAVPVGSSTAEHFRGSLADIGLTDLLQLLSTARKSGVLVLRSVDMLGKVFLEKGQIIYATMDEVEPVDPQKTFYRLLRWNTGSFEFEEPARTIFPSRIDENTDHLLLEAMHQLDEINNLGPDLPSMHAEVAIASPLPVPLKELAPGDLDFLQLVMRHKLVRDILDHYAGNDFEGYTYIKSLVGRGFLTISL